MASQLPDYLAAAKPLPQSSRAPWYKNVAQTYAGIMLWFVFWQGLPGAGGTPGGTLAHGIGTAIVGIIIAALVCHFLFYLAPGLLGMKTGLPLYVVGTSVYGSRGGLIMPGFVMGILQFGWLGVNAYGVATILCKCFDIGVKEGAVVYPIVHPVHAVIVVVFAALAAFMGLKGIQYVARVASFLPLIPLAILLVLVAVTIGGVGHFSPSQIPAGTATGSALGSTEIIILLSTVIVGFFATAGAAGTDLAMNCRNNKDVQMGGLTGIALATLVAGGLSVLIVAGAYGAGLVPDNLKGELNPLNLMKGTKDGGLLSPNVANIFMILLAISSFPSACFSAFIAANSFKVVMPRVNPFLSVGIGTLVAVVLAVTGLTGKVVEVFVVIGASFGPVCGAMAADYLLSGGKWSGPRAGFNPAGWISWVAGFVVGAFSFIAGVIPQLHGLENAIPCPPIAAFVVGFVLYALLAKLGLQSRTLPMPGKD